MKLRLLRPLVCCCVAFSSVTFVQAGEVIVQPTFDASNQAQAPDTTDYEGNFYDFSTRSPRPGSTIGAFDFAIPAGDYVTGATISGTFGDINVPVTALTDLFVNNGSIEVAACDAPGGNFPPCAAGTADNSLVPWSYTFSATDLSNLGDFGSGSLDFTAVQNGFGRRDRGYTGSRSRRGSGSRARHPAHSGQRARGGSSFAPTQVGVRSISKEKPGT